MKFIQHAKTTYDVFTWVSILVHSMGHINSLQKTSMRKRRGRPLHYLFVLTLQAVNSTEIMGVRSLLLKADSCQCWFHHWTAVLYTVNTTATLDIALCTHQPVNSWKESTVQSRGNHMIVSLMHTGVDFYPMTKGALSLPASVRPSAHPSVGPSVNVTLSAR